MRKSIDAADYDIGIFYYGDLSIGAINKNGYLSQAFFKIMIRRKAQFVSGPFTNMVFEILEKQKNKLKILVDNIVTTIPNKTNYLYRPI